MVRPMIVNLSFILVSIAYFCISTSSLGGEYSWSFTDEMPEEENRQVQLRFKVKFKEESFVDTDWVEVGDVISCNLDVVGCREFLNQTIIKAPEPGKKNKVTLSFIKEKLLEENPSLDFEKDDRRYIQINSLAQEITALEVQSSFDSLLSTFSQGLEGIKIKVASLTLLRPWIIRPHEFHFEFDGWTSMMEETSVSRLLKQYRQRAKIEVREIPLDAVHAPSKRFALVKLAFLKPVLVAKKPMLKGMYIDKDSFKLELRQVHSNLGNYPDKLSDVANFVLRRPISPGKTLQFADLEKPLAIRRGQIVLMELGSGSYVVTAKVKAKQSGRLGDIIEVVYEPTKKRLKAKVAASNLLKQVSAL